MRAWGLLFKSLMLGFIIYSLYRNSLACILTAIKLKRKIGPFQNFNWTKRVLKIFIAM
jgi:hypothetical protein